MKLSEIEIRCSEIEALRMELEEKDGEVREKDGLVNKLRSKLAQDSEHYQGLIHTRDLETKTVVRAK